MHLLASPLSILWLVINVLIIGTYVSGYTALGKENGLLENAQVVLLFSAFLLALFKWRRDLPSQFRFLLWGAGLLAISFFLRELDLRRTELNDWVIYFTSEKGRTWLTILLWLPFFYFVGRHFRWSFNTGLHYARSYSFWLYVIAAIWLVAGAFFDKGIIETEHKYFMEEFLEVNGYAFFLLAMAKMNQLELLKRTKVKHSSGDHALM